VCLTQTVANCIDCHMPKVSPQIPLRFTNHWIGVYGPGAKLKPIR
jgi:formate-dependent nitrite reductase cytochrome c552 subunit